MRWWIRLAFTAVSFASAVAAQAQDQSPSARAKTNRENPDDIVVQGILPGEPLFRLKHPVPTAAAQIRTINERSERFARCAKSIDPTLLRHIVDGPVHTPRMDYSLDRAIRTNIGCYSDSYTPQQPEPFYGFCNVVEIRPFGICRSLYDRAAIVAEVVHRYASDIALVPAQTANPVIQKRVSALGMRRFRHADRIEKQMAQLALCVVAAEPERATHLVRAHGDPRLQARIAAEMLAYGAACLGNAKSFAMEPLQFRSALIEAFYHWAVAARGVESLIPPDS